MVFNVKKLQVILSILISLCLLSVYEAALQNCSREEAIKAENDIDNLKDWERIDHTKTLHTVMMGLFGKDIVTQ